MVARIDEGVPPHRGHRAPEETEHDCEESRREGQDEGVDDAIGEELRDGNPIGDRLAEVSLDYAPEPLEVLDVEGEVEPVELAELRDPFLGRERSEQGEGEVAGDETHQEKRHDGDPEQDRDHRERPAANQLEHRSVALRRVVGRPRARAWCPAPGRP